MLQLRDLNGIYIAHENYRYMLDKMLENEELIKEKTSELIALKEAMDKKKNLFDEVEKNMIYKSREIQRVKEELEAKETKLSKVNDMLKETVRAKEEQEHLVSKHVETEVKLKIQGKKLLAGCDEIGQDLEKLHNKLDNVKEINTGNDEAKDSFMLNIEKTVEDLSKRIEEFGRENELRSGVMKDCLNQELSERQNQIAGIISELQNLMTDCSNNASTANSFTPVSDKLIPTGAIASVAGTVFDLRSPTRLGDVLSKCPGGDNNGFDHNFVLANTGGVLNFVCRVVHPGSGRWLECFTDQPGVQFYTGNFIPTDDSLTGKNGAKYRKHGGFCLETQKFPDSINQPSFPSCVVRPGEQYQHTVLYKFGC